MNDMTAKRPGSTGYRVDVIDTFPAFQAAETAWKALEAQDPETTVFLSWDWLAQAFRDNPYRWSVLAVRAPGVPGFAALLPLKYRVHWSRSRNEFQTELEAGGRLLFSEYTGFLCDPAHEAAVLRALAQRLAHMPWAKLSMRYVGQTQRAELFCEAMEGLGCDVTWKEYRINSGETDNLVCPRIPLPDDFEEYLQTRVSSNTRQQYRRFKRRHFADGAYRFSHADARTLDRDIDLLMRFWIARWSEQKGAEKAAKVAANFEQVLRAAHQAEALFLPVLWRDDTPLGALGHIMDPRTGAMHFIIAGRDTEAEEAFIGSALHFHSIESAIYLGCQSYDFGHGDEAYKFSYGAEANRLLYFTVTRPQEAAAGVFDSLSTGAALARIEDFLRAGKTERARRACRQLSRLFS